MNSYKSIRNCLKNTNFMNECLDYIDYNYEYDTIHCFDFDNSVHIRIYWFYIICVAQRISVLENHTIIGAYLNINDFIKCVDENIVYCRRSHDIKIALKD